tara:strand:+ start:1491 stop:2576 length:1086 start_codon:yes stop_codon:yes gene_type:complete
MSIGIALAEHGLVPDWILRIAIRSLLRKRLNTVGTSSPSDIKERTDQHILAMKNGPLLLASEEAKTQHYEVPTNFFKHVLGPRLKYSCGLWPDKTTDLQSSEEAMLQLTCKRAQINDGMRILDLGAGWGSLALWIAEHFPKSEIVTVSNSTTQRDHIVRQCNLHGYQNVEAIAENINSFDPQRTFDRIVSIEMFEHIRNYELLLTRLCSWLHTDGRLFVHVFCNRQFPYFFEDADSDDWMARHFFTGGMMPSERLLFHFKKQIKVESYWRVNGREYQRTSEAWLQNLDANRKEVTQILSNQTCDSQPAIAVTRWRLFFLACSELFGYKNGTEWYVSHYLLSPVLKHEKPTTTWSSANRTTK